MVVLAFVINVSVAGEVQDEKHVLFFCKCAEASVRAAHEIQRPF